MDRMPLSSDALADERHSDRVRTIRELYYSAARYQDWLLGRFVSVIEAGDRPTVVVVVSDHGENLGDHGLFSHNSSLWQTLLHVPLVLWGHKVEVPSERSDRPVSLLRLADWLRGMADGQPVSLYGDGPIVSEYESTVRQCGIPAKIRARIDSGDHSGVPPLVSNPGVAIRMGRLKYVAVQGGPHAQYDLDADPGETHNLLPEQPEAGAEFLPFVAAWQERRARQPRYSSGEIADGEIAEHLRGLGYIE
jgi:arylsulfatase A-like enzyme